MIQTTLRTYTELTQLKTFEDRLLYLRLDGDVGFATFGYDRWLNQDFYRSNEWKDIRRQIILRDYGCDMGLQDYPIGGKILIHHMNPITQKDILSHSDKLISPEYLICVSHNTHNMIHYGNTDYIPQLVERTPNDTCPWRK